MTHCSYPVCVRERQGDSTCHLFWTRFGPAWDRVRTFITSLVRLEGGKRGKRLAVEMQVQWCVHDTGGCGVAAPICHISQHEQGCGLHNAHSAHCSWAWEESSMDMLCIRKKKGRVGGGLGLCDIIAWAMMEDNVASSGKSGCREGTSPGFALVLSVLHDYIRVLSFYCAFPELVVVGLELLWNHCCGNDYDPKCRKLCELLIFYSICDAPHCIFVHVWSFQRLRSFYNRALRL